MKENNYQVCSVTVMDTSDPNITFDENGVCDRCTQYEKDILPDWNYGKGKEQKLEELVSKIKREGKGKKYDCLLGFSGGFDSSYMLHFAIKELGLHPLVFHVDAGWNIPFAEDNIRKMTNKLGVDLKIEKIDWNEIRDMQLAFFKSGVPHLDIPQDHAFVAVLDNYAEKYNIKYILNGGNISTEVIVNPSAWGYWGTDMAQINDILKQFGSVEMKTYPFTNVYKRKIYMPYVKGVKVVKLLNYTPYIKKDAESLLIRGYDWTPYKQKHFESIMTKFIEGYWLPARFGYDVRKPQYSSLILTGQMTREEALEKLKNPPLTEKESAELFSQVASMLEISEDELNNYLTMPLKTYKDYKNQDYLIGIGSKIMYKLKMDKLIRK
jgi:N-acetyl sugar amidotransferase